MASLLRFSAVAAMVYSVTAGRSTYGSIPSQTAGGCGQPIFEAMPTEAPSLELVKRKMERKALTNVCSEWTILGAGNGQPQCYNSQTCLFSSVGDLYYEGCGQTSVSYDWITECYNYPKSGVAGVSQTFCNAAEPHCGVFEFIFDSGYTFSNFGCSTKSYSYIATLLGTTRELAGGGTTKLTLTLTTTATGDTTSSTGSTTNFGGDITPTPTPTPYPSPIIIKRPVPIGAIVGGVVGGIAVIAILGFMAWYCMRKRKQDKAATAGAHQHQADAATTAAFHNSQGQRMSEIDGTMKPAAAFVPINQSNNYSAPPEKPLASTAVHEYRPVAQNQHNASYPTDPYSGTHSPPPVYFQPSPQQQTISSPSSGYTELDHTQTARQSGTPVSPGNSTFMSTNPSELGGGDNRISYQAYSPPPLTQSSMSEMGAGSSGGVTRRPVASAGPEVDMNGAPLNENYRHHELA